MTAPETIARYLREHLNPARFRHTLGTLKVARELAVRNKVPAAKTTYAALLHDAGKALTEREMIRYVRYHRLRLPLKEDIIRFNPSLLHSFISADIACRVFGIDDQEILDAIAAHTVGAPAMTTLAKIIYLADVIAPDRHYRGVQRLRAQARHDLDGAFMTAMGHKISYVVEHREWIHPATIKIWNAMVHGA